MISKVFLIIISSVLGLIPLYILKLLVDELSNTEISFDYIVKVLLVLGAVQVLSVIISNVSGYIHLLHIDIVTDHMSGVMVDKSINLDMPYFDSNKYYDIKQLAQAQATSRPIAVVDTLVATLKNIVSLIIIGAVITQLHWALILAVVLLALPSSYIRYIFTQKTVALREQQIPASRKAGVFSSMLTAASSAKDLRIFHYGQNIKNKYLGLLKVLRKERRDLYLSQTIYVALVSLIQILAVLFGVAYVAYSASKGQISLGDVAMYFGLFQKGQSEVKAMLGKFVSLVEHKLYLDHLYRYLDIKPILFVSNSPKKVPERIDSLKIEGLSFAYPGKKRWTLQDVNTEFRKGSITAIVGENGSGKTTLVKLINRFYDPQKGSIQLNGVDIKLFEKTAFRSQISSLFQRFSNFALTVGENISLSDIELDNKARLLAVAKQAQAESYIEKLPYKFNTQLGRMFEDGEELSGGQWQKLALARSLYKEASILIFDEPTSQIDPLAEEDIFNSIRKLANDKIVILVTHRIYNLAHVDNILVMSNGRITENGNHRELMAKRSIYYEMFQNQSQHL